MMSEGTYPANYSTLFNAQNIRIQFDEWVSIKNPRQEVSVNPLLPNPIDIKLKGKRIEIALNNDLTPNTTYTINFGNSISDITQNNVLKNFRYVFSTGSVLDSLEYRGTVYDAYTNTPVENALVGLYTANIPADQLPDTLPSYYTYTNEGGWFSFENLRKDEFRILAIEDKDVDLKFRAANEKMAFADSIIQPLFEDSAASMISLYLGKNKGDQLKILQQNGNQQGSIQVVFDRPFENARLSLVNTPVAAYKKWSTDKDTLQLFWNKLNVPEVELLIQQEDHTPDTLSIPLTSPAQPFKMKEKQMLVDANRDIVLHFNTAIDDFRGEDLVLLDQDSTQLPFSVQVNPENHLELIGKAHLQPESNYSLTVNQGAVMDVFGNPVEEKVVTIRTTAEKYWGKLNLNIESNTYDNYFVELLTEKGDLVQKKGPFYGPFNTEFDHLKPGKYLVKLYFDRNGNNYWDAGLYPSRQPEKVLFYPEVIDIRPNWEVLEIWSLDP